MTCLVCPLKNGGSSSTSSISKSSSGEQRTELIEGRQHACAIIVNLNPSSFSTNYTGAETRKRKRSRKCSFLTLFVVNFGKDASFVIKVGELLFGQDVGSNHLRKNKTP